MTSLEICNCEIGTIRSRKDHSVVFSVETPELRVSESGQLMQWHGRACTVTIMPHEGAPEEVVKVDTERRVKSKGERLRAIYWLIWQKRGETTNFDQWYDARFELLADKLKEQLD